MKQRTTDNCRLTKSQHRMRMRPEQIGFHSRGCDAKTGQQVVIRGDKTLFLACWKENVRDSEQRLFWRPAESEKGGGPRGDALKAILVEKGMNVIPKGHDKGTKDTIKGIKGINVIPKGHNNASRLL
eukprot:356906-Chlamydomonas_euryale.AAC.3